jgi:hypothetical protein
MRFSSVVVFFGLVLSACNCGGTLTLQAGTSPDGGGLADGGAAGGGAQSGGGGGGAPVGGGGVGTGGSGGGSAGPVCAGNSGQAATRPVDLIIAIDQSASMGEEINGVISNINAKLASILAANGVDYRVIFVGGNFCIAPPLGASATAPGCYDSNPPRYFHATAPVNSSDALTLLLWTYDGFYKGPNTCNKVSKPEVRWSDKLRFDAQKVFIVVTDDDPASFSYVAQGCTSTTYCANWQCPTYADRAADWPGGQDFVTELYKLQPAGMFGTAANPKWIFHAIVSVAQQLGPTEPLSSGPLCAFSGNTGETTGLEYQKLARLTGGTRFPTCNTDYSPVFQKIANSILPLACEFDLLPTGLGVPDPSSTSVSVGFDGGVAMPVARDESLPCQLGANGWQLAANGTRIVLCGAACDAVRTTPGAQLTVSVGCEAGTIDGGYDAGSIDETADGGGVCVKVGQPCQVGGARCCFGLECTPAGDGGSSCDSVIN